MALILHNAINSFITEGKEKEPGLFKTELSYGAEEEIRTLTGVTPQNPESCASTDSATSAALTLKSRVILFIFLSFVKHF